MSKRFISVLLVICLFAGLLTTECFALGSTSQVEYLDDGGYIITTTQIINSRASNSTSGTRRQSRYDSDDNLVWQIILRGVFTYTGSASTCTESTIAVNIYNDNFSEVSRSATKSGNTAYGSATIKRKVLGVTISTDTYPLTLTCDNNGNLS